MKKWELSKEQAIEEHRKMWGWIYDTVKNRIETGNYKKDGMFNYEDIDAISLKIEYLKRLYLDFKHLENNCFLCEYAKCHTFISCKESCPVKWTNGECMFPGSEYVEVIHMTLQITETGNIPEDYLETIKKIRDLPVKEKTND